MSAVLTLEELVQKVTEENDFDASGIRIGVEQEAQSQYPLVTVKDTTVDEK